MVAVSDQLAGADWKHGHTVFVSFDFFGNADNHSQASPLQDTYRERLLGTRIVQPELAQGKGRISGISCRNWLSRVSLPWAGMPAKMNLYASKSVEDKELIGTVRISYLKNGPIRESRSR